SRRPADPLYLRSFIGNKYDGSRWTRANDLRLLQRAAKKSHWRYQSYLEWIFASIYYNMNSYTNAQAQGRSISVGVGDYSQPLENYYVPYWSNYSTSQARTNYSYDLYERRDMKIDWSKPAVQVGDDYYWNSNPAGFTAYKKQVRALIRAYRQVSRKKSPRLSRLVASVKKQGKVKTMAQVTSFISSLLKRNARYTRSPGLVPLGEDPVDYFLFESHRGYCIQYASTATLIYRMFGIPARYVSGYIVQPSQFKRGRQGLQATVTDYQAHAWTEVFLEDYGWVPVDFTPDTAGNIQASYPGYKQQSLPSVTPLFQRQSAKKPPAKSRRAEG
ncbi:transglutaminase-like domain-containing protein, partial [Lactobacillus nasalidis]